MLIGLTTSVGGRFRGLVCSRFCDVVNHSERALSDMWVVTQFKCFYANYYSFDY